MEQVTANLAGTMRRAKLGGRDHIVVPTTMIVPGVLNGSKGALLYPPEEIGKDLSAWNGMPLVVYHPTDNGSPVSARSPSVLDRQSVGQVFHAKQSDKGKLQAEAWFDVERLQKIDNRVLQALERNQPLELSTGLFTANEPAKEGAEFNGTPYSFIARNYRPDHLAILPDQKGACSIDDGCGINVNKKQEANTMSKMSDEQRKAVIDGLIANSCCWEEADRETLNTLDETKLATLKGQVEKDQKREVVINAARKEFKDSEGSTHTWNEEKGAWNTKAPEKKGEPVINKDTKPPTEEEWLAKAPVSVQEDLAFARNEKSKQKEEIVEKLVANVKDPEEKKRLSERFMKGKLQDLQDMVKVLPEEKKPTSNYSGAATVGPITNDAEASFAPFGLPDEYIELEEAK